MPDVVITEFMHEASALTLRSEFDVSYEVSLADDRSRLLALLSEARAIVVRNRTRVDSELLDAAPNLQLVARLGVGLDNIDVAACQAKGVSVAPATGANAVAVAEYVIAALLVLHRNVFGLSDSVASGEWPRTTAVGEELMGTRLGLVGFGIIAREVARRAVALGAEVVATDPYLEPNDPAWGEVRPVEMAELLASCRSVSLHVPLTAETRHLIDRKSISLMPQGAFIVNTSRGGIVEEQALVEALRSGHLGGAALDVFEQEPVDAAGGSVFDDAPNLLLTPNIAGITNQSEARIGDMTVDAIRATLGRPA